MKLLLSACLMVLAPLASGVPVAVDCPLACPATASNDVQGTLPLQITYRLLLEAIPRPGDAKEGCETCSICKLDGGLSFDNHGHNYVITVDVQGVPSPPQETFNRPGMMHADCKSSFYVWITIWDTETGLPVYTESPGLDCGCDHQGG